MTGRVVIPFDLYSTAGARSSPVSLGWGFESHPRRRENLSCPSGSLLHELNKLTISHFFILFLSLSLSFEAIYWSIFIWKKFSKALDLASRCSKVASVNSSAKLFGTFSFLSSDMLRKLWLGLIDGSDPLFGVFSGFDSPPPPVGMLSPGD